MKAKHLTIQQRAQIAEDYGKGINTKTIAKIWDISVKDVNNIISYMRKNGAVIPRRRKEYKKTTKIVETKVEQPEQEDEGGVILVFVILVVVAIVYWVL